MQSAKVGNPRPAFQQAATNEHQLSAGAKRPSPINTSARLRKSDVES